MATGHIQPGYGDTVSKFRRVRSAGFPLDKETLRRIAEKKALPRGELERIRKKGAVLWSYPQNTETSYDSHYCFRHADEKRTVRPSSPTRMNRPHPPQTFLVSRLHHIPGYHNADTTIGKDVYRVDASLPSDLRVLRQAFRQKYIGRQNGAWASCYKDPLSIKEQLGGGRSGQAAEAWIKIADEKDHEKVFNAVHEDEENERKQETTGVTRSKTAYPSLTRWMRFAGAREADIIMNAARSLEAHRKQDFKTPSTPNPFHGRPALSSISSVQSSSDLPSQPHHVRF